MFDTTVPFTGLYLTKKLKESTHKNIYERTFFAVICSGKNRESVNRCMYYSDTIIHYTAIKNK